MTINDLFSDWDGYKSYHKLSYDTYENNKEFFIEVMLPGFKKDDIKIDYNDKKLTIKSEREKNEKFDYYQINTFFGKINESFKLPFEPESIEVSFEDGVLRIKLNKKESNLPAIKFL
jgi:HSP20 family protein